MASIRIDEHKTSPNSSVRKHEIDFEGFEIIDRASNDQKLCWKEMLHIRYQNPSLNVQDESELFTLIIRNTAKASDRTRDIEKYVKKPNTNFINV